MRGEAAVATLLAVAVMPFAVAEHELVDLERDAPMACLVRDCIVALDDPAFDDGAWLAADDLVVGVVIAGDARAFPTRVLDRHEIANTNIGGTPVAVTWCPLCGTGIAFERVVAGEVTTLGVSGRLYRNDLVMYDRATESLWSQALGTALIGPRHGDALTFVPATTTAWSDWQRAHPTTQVLARPAGYPAAAYDVEPYAWYAASERTLQDVWTPWSVLPAKTWVLGVRVGDAAWAVPHAVVKERGLVTDVVGDARVAVVTVAGAPQAFVVPDAGPWVVTSGGLTDALGRTFETSSGAGPHGERLDAPHQLSAYWFAWHDFNPDTRLHGVLRTTLTPPWDDGFTTLAFNEPVDQAAVAQALGVPVTWTSDRELRVDAARFGAPVLPAGVYGSNGAALTRDVVFPPADAADATQGAAAAARAPWWLLPGALAAVFVIGVLRHRVLR